MSEQPNYCPYCGKQLDFSLGYRAEFCPYCGKPLELPGEAPAPRAPEHAAEERKVSSSFLSEKAVEERISAVSEGARRVAASARKGRRKTTLAGWYFAVLAWAFAFGALLGVAENPYNGLASTVLLPLLILATFPIWFPCFHPWRSDPKRKKGVWLRWSLIMAALLILIVILVDKPV